MYATIQRWGNSQGLRIPKALLDTIGLRENDRVELLQEEDSIRIQKLPQARHRTLEERYLNKGTSSIWTLIPRQAMSSVAAGQPWWSATISSTV